MLQNWRCLHNVAGVAELFKVFVIITETLKNIAEVAGVAVLSKCCKCCSVLKKKWQVLQGFSKENAAGLFECCRDVNKRCKCARFPNT